MRQIIQVMVNEILYNNLPSFVSYQFLPIYASLTPFLKCEFISVVIWSNIIYKSLKQKSRLLKNQCIGKLNKKNGVTNDEQFLRKYFL